MSEQNLVDTPPQAAAGDVGGDFGDGDFEPGDGGTEQPGAGGRQSKSSRRRRRKRKNRVEGAAPANAGDGNGESTGGATPVVMEGESLALAASAAPAAAATSQPAPRKQHGNGQGGSQNQQGGNGPNNGSSNGAGNGQNGQGPGKRWKKKFRDRERRTRDDSPGNSVRAESGSSSSAAPHNNGGGGGYREGGHRPDNFGNQVNFKRKGKGGGSNGGGSRERGFVGPMDHSYREVGSGDGPPSTIQVHAGARRSGHRHHGDNQPIDHNMPRPIPIPEGAQTHIYFFIEELFFIAKIQETARKQGVKVSFLKNEKDAVAELTSGEELNKPALIVFDLNNANAKPLTLIPKLKAKLKRGTSIVGFLSHLQGDLKAKAVEAGCDVVMPRAAFSQNLPNLLRRYGVEEAEEINYNY